MNASGFAQAVVGVFQAPTVADVPPGNVRVSGEPADLRAPGAVLAGTGERERAIAVARAVLAGADNGSDTALLARAYLRGDRGKRGGVMAISRRDAADGHLAEHRRLGRSDGPFQTMERKLEHEKHPPADPAAVAAKIGREKLGQAEMTRRSVAGREK